jgi:hypothetical protein
VSVSTRAASVSSGSLTGTSTVGDSVTSLAVPYKALKCG